MLRDIRKLNYDSNKEKVKAQRAKIYQKLATCEVRDENLEDVINVSLEIMNTECYHLFFGKGVCFKEGQEFDLDNPNSIGFSLLNKAIQNVEADKVISTLNEVSKKNIASVQKNLVLMEVYLAILPNVQDKSKYLGKTFPYFAFVLATKQKKYTEYQ